MKYLAIVGTSRKSTKNAGKGSVIQDNSQDDKAMEFFVVSIWFLFYQKRMERNMTTVNCPNHSREAVFLLEL